MTVRFGDFELDTIGCRLMREGRDLRLPKQPFDLLTLLVTRSGELVTREEICQALWGSPTMEGSEHSINTTIRKIRAALGDDPVAPRYIETVVRRGYRFLAPVVNAAPIGNAAPEPVPVQSLPGPGWRLRIAAPLVTVVLALLAGIVVWALNRPWSSPPQLAWKPITKAIHLRSNLVSDRRNVYWTEDEKLGCRVWQAPLEGGADPAPVQSPFSHAYVTDADRNGQLLVVVPENCRAVDFGSVQGPLWELTPSSGQARRVGNLVVQNAAWSSDGRRIAFAQWNQLWLANRDGSQPRKLATLPGDLTNLRWSPDSKLLRFCLVVSANWAYPLWEADTDTGKAHPVLPDWSEGSLRNGGAWTSDGAFVFGSAQPGHSDLWQLVPAAWPSSRNTLRQLTRGPLDFTGPVSIPGRAELAVVGSNKQSELVRYSFAEDRFVPVLNGISAEMLHFSSDGQWATYVSYPERDLWRSRADGSDARQLTHGPLRAALPRISPDSRTIAFTGDYSGRELRTWVIPLEGGQPRPATQLAPGSAEVGPKWSPDGKKLLMRLDRPGRPNLLQIVDVATGLAETVPSSERKLNQRWSPDGKWLAATPYDAPGLHVYNVAKRQWSTATTMPADYPEFSRKGDFIHFCTTLESGEVAIYKVSPEGGKPERVASLSDTIRAHDEMYNQWVGIALDDSPLVARSADLQRIYLLGIR